MNSGKNFGFVNKITDIDGTIRKVQLVQAFKGRLYFNLALTMLIDECKVKKENIIVNPEKNIILKNACNTKDHITEDIIIPIDKKGMLFVNWSSPGPREESFTLIPFFSLIEYPRFADAVYEFFDNAGGIAGIQKRAQLSRAIQEKKAFLKQSDADSRKEAAIELKYLQKELFDLKQSYLNMLTEEKNRIIAEIESNPSEDLKNELTLIKGDIKAVELVLLAESVKDKNLIIGLTATGTHDIGSIPLHNEYPGVGTYLNTINTIIQNEYIYRPGFIFSIILFLIISLAAGFVIQKLHARKSLITGLISFIMLNLIIFLIFDFANIWVEQLGSNLALLIPALSIISIKLINEENQKKFIKGAFSRYIAPDVINQILEHPESLELGGENRPLTIFFSDVAGFSTLSEKLTPPELVALLNEYLSAMTDIIISHGGTIDKYEGDAIMAFYGAPQSYPDHEIRACMAAIDMKKRLREMQEHWREVGQHELFVRMGMNTGDAVVGNMGSRLRMDYTAMGDSVNLASRLEGANKFYSTTAMISEFTYNGSADHIETRKLDTIRVIGKTEPIVIYELLSRKGELPQKIYDMIEIYNQGLEFFASRQWKKAHKAFKDALKIIPDDGPSRTYLKRCENFMKKPPSQKWDGVFSLTSK
jgi:adenylate cyclase